MGTARRHAFLGLLLCLASPVLAPGGAAAQDPTETILTTPIVLSGFANGAVFDFTGQKLVAGAPMPYVVKIDGSQNKDGQTFTITVKLGIVDANGLATNGVEITGIQDSDITIGSIQRATGDGLFAHTSGISTGLFNNFIRVGSLVGNKGNGAVFQSPHTGVYGAQGNHIEIGQVAANGKSGIVLIGVTTDNYLVVGPVEHNGLYGCAQDQLPNTWVVVNSNNNGKKQAC